MEPVRLYAVCHGILERDFWHVCGYYLYEQVPAFSVAKFCAEAGAVKGVEELVSLFDSYGSVDGSLSCVIAILYFGTVYSLEKIGSGVLVKPWTRGLLADYAYPASLLQQS